MAIGTDFFGQIFNRQPVAAGTSYMPFGLGSYEQTALAPTALSISPQPGSLSSFFGSPYQYPLWGNQAFDFRILLWLLLLGQGIYPTTPQTGDLRSQLEGRSFGDPRNPLPPRYFGEPESASHILVNKLGYTFKGNFTPDFPPGTVGIPERNMTYLFQKGFNESVHVTVEWQSGRVINVVPASNPVASTNIDSLRAALLGKPRQQAVDLITKSENQGGFGFEADPLPLQDPINGSPENRTVYYTKRNPDGSIRLRVGVTFDGLGSTALVTAVSLVPVELTLDERLRGQPLNSALQILNGPPHYYRDFVLGSVDGREVATLNHYNALGQVDDTIHLALRRGIDFQYAVMDVSHTGTVTPGGTLPAELQSINGIPFTGSLQDVLYNKGYTLVGRSAAGNQVYKSRNHYTSTPFYFEFIPTNGGFNPEYHAVSINPTGPPPYPATLAERLQGLHFTNATTLLASMGFGTPVVIRPAVDPLAGSSTVYRFTDLRNPAHIVDVTVSVGGIWSEGSNNHVRSAVETGGGQHI